MITKYGLQIESPFDLKSSATVAISVAPGEAKTIDRASATGVLAIIVEEGGTLNYTEKISSPGLCHTYIYLKGSKSTANIFSRVMQIEGIADISHQIFHEENNTFSNINTKGVVRGDSTVIYTSGIGVRPDIQDIEGSQNAAFILLESTASVKTIPGLSVYSDKVSCSHKVSVTPIDLKKVEYLAMRGFTQGEARDILVAAFLI